MTELITVEEACRIAKFSKATLYRRIKRNPDGKLFPKPKKIPAISHLGPRTINRWDYAEIMKWLLQGNDPKWTKPPVLEAVEAIEAYVNNPWYKKHKLVITSVSGGLLAALAVYVFEN
jgi:predicted DNA-binding transcriptional regulator AlpA|tara:strand:+ start:377 stop:730 length:354 start_codon:yes stop_codon:yes gene_type:complete